MMGGCAQRQRPAKMLAAARADHLEAAHRVGKRMIATASSRRPRPKPPERHSMFVRLAVGTICDFRAIERRSSNERRNKASSQMLKGNAEIAVALHDFRESPCHGV